MILAYNHAGMDLILGEQPLSSDTLLPCNHRLLPFQKYLSLKFGCNDRPGVISFLQASHCGSDLSAVEGY